MGEMNEASMESTFFCFGEILLRMSPELGGAWLENARMPVYVGGAEANVACALATWGQPVAYCTAMPDHYLGREMAAYLSARGVDTRSIQWMGSRVGTYYLPQGTDLQNAGVIYDRADSSFGRLKPGLIDWDVLLAGTGWFHFSAISPALSRDVAAVCREALDACIRKGIRVSVDLNYRPKLWKYGVSPVEVMPELVEACDVVMGNLWAAESLLGIPVDEHIHRAPERQRYLNHSLATSEAILRRFPRCRQVAHTFRFEEAGELRYYATLYEKGGALYASTEFRTRSVVDKVGSGDCFMAGLIHGISSGWAPPRIIHYAAAAAFGKLQEQGDATRQTVQQIEAIVERYA
jgi:2-dehydro-3-deoxygluconokinase